MSVFTASIDHCDLFFLMQKEDLNKDMRDFDQVVESFKDHVREQWEDPTVRRALKTFRNYFKKGFWTYEGNRIRNRLIRVDQIKPKRKA